ncbi:MAG: DUF2877 domain-containing protein [Nitrospinae bacterium]|nr:DUF2877 domain-containing protein [Nitrospinota bacterium]
MKSIGHFIMRVRYMHFISKINLVGVFAREFLDAPDEANVIGVFRRSLYIENSSGRIACIGERGIGPGPLNALCEFSDDVDFTRIVEPGSPVEFRDAWIKLGPRMKIDISSPMDWEPEPLPIGWDLKIFQQNLPFLIEYIAETGPREGLAPLIEHIVSGEEISNEDAFQTISWEGISDFRNWLSHSLNQGGNLDFPANALQLVGLGPGLTPSGDDFWCGVMIALHALGHFEIPEKIAGAVLCHAKERTNRISCAHMECAARGQGAQALHETVAAMGVADEARLRSVLRALNKIGHTSGWDSLAGVVCVLESVASWKGRPVPV